MFSNGIPAYNKCLDGDELFGRDAAGNIVIDALAVAIDVVVLAKYPEVAFDNVAALADVAGTDDADADIGDTLFGGDDDYDDADQTGGGGCDDAADADVGFLSFVAHLFDLECGDPIHCDNLVFGSLCSQHAPSVP